MTFHPRNAHQGEYDFAALIAGTPALAPFVTPTAHAGMSIDFADPAAVKALNRALLKTSYGVDSWDVPPQYLCPPIPGRADYIHHLADLLGGSDGGVIPRGGAIRALDVGVGANCVYPLIGHREYGWRFVGSDVDKGALANARKIVQENGLQEAIEIRPQATATKIFKGVVKPNEAFDVSLCNPPFHVSLAEAHAGAARKWQNLGKVGIRENPKAPVLNFGGQSNELHCPGGEAGFIRRMIEESEAFRAQIFWFTTLVSKADNLPDIYKAIKKAGAWDRKTLEMAQGQKKSRMVAWTFLDKRAQHEWRLARWRGKPAKA